MDLSIYVPMGVILAFLSGGFFIYRRCFHGIRLPRAVSFQKRAWATQKRGIVIAGGGKYLPLTLKLVAALRGTGCVLPILIVHADDEEWDIPPDQEARLMDMGISHQNAMCMFPDQKINLKGYQLKPFAVWMSPFREVILLDADVIPLRDLSYLFDTDVYQDQGALFWPDVASPSDTQFLKPEIWRQLSIKEPDDPWQQEASCLVLDLERHARSLDFTCKLNYIHKKTYRYVYGDKDTWRIGCLLAGKGYRFVSYTPGSIIDMGKTFIHYDPYGSMLYMQGEGLRNAGGQLTSDVLQYVSHARWHHPRRAPSVLKNGPEDYLPLPDDHKEMLSKWADHPN